MPAFLPLVRQLPEQHWLPALHVDPLLLHWHAGDALQAASLQSIAALQLSSIPLPQTSLSPPQSTAHTEQFSALSQVSLPQQKLPGTDGTVVQVRPLAEQRLSEHGIAPEPEPSPQQ